MYILGESSEYCIEVFQLTIPTNSSFNSLFMANSCRKKNINFTLLRALQKNDIYINAYTAQSYLELKLKIHEGVYLTIMKESKVQIDSNIPIQTEQITFSLLGRNYSVINVLSLMQYGHIKPQRVDAGNEITLYNGALHLRFMVGRGAML